MNGIKLFRTKGIIQNRIKSHFNPVWLGSDLKTTLHSIRSDWNRIFEFEFNRIRIQMFEYQSKFDLLASFGLGYRIFLEKLCGNQQGRILAKAYKEEPKKHKARKKMVRLRLRHLRWTHLLDKDQWPVRNAGEKGNPKRKYSILTIDLSCMSAHRLINLSYLFGAGAQKSIWAMNINTSYPTPLASLPVIITDDPTYWNGPISASTDV